MGQLWNKVFVAAAILLCGLAGAAAAAERTVDAFAVWNAQGKMTAAGDQSSSFAGSFSGTLYVETDGGPTEIGAIDCPGTLDLNLADASQKG
jgi:hypothetical protein